MKHYPQRGGGKYCAEALGVSPQQWSPWETGRRMPGAIRLQQIADFFGVTVDDLRKDNRPPPPDTATPSHPPNPGEPHPHIGRIPGIDTPPPSGWQPEPPGTPASLFWLLRHFIAGIQTQGVLIDKRCLDYLAARLKSPES